MDSSMTMGSSATSTMSGMGSMSTGMGGAMDSSSMSMSMSMVFTTDHSTPLFSTAWTPASTGAYAGTCIFLIVLAVISRMLLAYRHILELKWHDKAIKRRYIVLAGESQADRERQMVAAGDKDEGTLTVRGLDEKVKVVRTARRGVETTPWRFSTDLPRSCVFVVQAGVGYLLMLAVMTLNVGYFLSVLAGLFVGELCVGRYSALDDGHH